ncbi:MAG: S-layer homology domain-containing protein, partial [Clostridia bacterium]|nr:S-layer homology domain-containing protein [Clostridia bacterium]
MKKLISLLLVLATVLSCFVLTVSADETTVVSDEGRLPFEDVKDSHWFAEAVTFCYANEIIKGMNDYTFGWNGNLTRAQFLQMLATIDGADLTGYQVSGFDDVKPNHWYYPAVAWAYETNLTSGVS